MKLVRKMNKPEVFFYLKERFPLFHCSLLFFTTLRYASTAAFWLFSPYLGSGAGFGLSLPSLCHPSQRAYTQQHKHFTVLIHFTYMYTPLVC